MAIVKIKPEWSEAGEDSPAPYRHPLQLAGGTPA